MTALVHRPLRAAIGLALLAAIGCTRQGDEREFIGPPTTVPTKSIERVVVTPGLGTVQKDEAIAFQAFGRGPAGDSVGVEVLWSASGGAVNAAGLFTAQTPGSYWVVARSQRDATKADSARVYVVGADNPVTGVEITPKQLAVRVGQLRQFSAVARLADGTSAPVPIFWSATGGVIEQNGAYTAVEAGEFLVIAVAASGVTDTARVTANPSPVLTTLRLDPQQVEVVQGEGEDFDVQAAWSDGAQRSTPVDFSTDAGTIDANGVFRAIATEGEYEVVATERLSGLRAIASVRIRKASLEYFGITPETSTLARGGKQLFIAAARYSNGVVSLVRPDWEATGGTISNWGVYTAGQAAGTYRVIATFGGMADTSVVFVEAPAATLTRINLTPATATVAAGATQEFSASALWSDGSTAVPDLSWSASGGSVSSNGTYTAPGTAGTHRVIARHVASGLADTSVVTVTAPVPTTVTISPRAAAVEAGRSTQFTATPGFGGTGGASAAPSAAPPEETIIWSATGGSISSNGTYVAGSQAGTYLVVARAASSGAADTGFVTVSVPPPALQSIAVSPGSAALQAGQVQQFAITATWSNGGTGTPVVSWSATGGTITSGGRYTAGSAAGTYRVIASAQGVADTSVVTIAPPAPVLVGIDLTPSVATVQAGGTQQFAVAGIWTNGGSGTPAVVYSATGGTVSASGLYTAGSQAGTFRVIATQQGATLADTSVITVTAAPPQLIGIEVSPEGASVTAGATQQFVAAGVWSNGGSGSPAVTWSATGGSISSTGVYTAGSSAGTFRVIAAQTGGTLRDTVSVTVAVVPPTLTAVRIQPKTASLQTGVQQQFSATATWSDGSTTLPALTWSATGGSVNTSGRYTAPSTAGTYRVIVRAQNGTRADTATVTVTAPVVTALNLTPATATVNAGATQQFSVSGVWSDGVSRAIAATYTTNGGTISSGGLYTAPSTGGTYRVVATLTGGSVADTSIVTVLAPTAPPPPPSGNGTPNRPSNYTRTLSDYGFSDNVPTAQDGQLGSSGWLASWNSAGLTRRGTSSSAPKSASSVLENLFRAGHTSGGGVGNVGRYLPNVNQIYVSFWVMHDANFEFHPISNKMLYLEPGNIILEARHFEDELVVVPAQSALYRPNIVPGFRLPLGRWVQIEYLVDAVADNFKLWIDGQLITNQNHNFSGNFQELKLDTTWGGAGGTKSRDSYRWVDHIVVATP